MITLGEIVLIHDLKRQGLSVSAIARKLGMDRKTVRKHRGGPAFLDSLAALLRLVHVLRYAASPIRSSPTWASRGVRPPRAEWGLSVL